MLILIMACMVFFILFLLNLKSAPNIVEEIHITEIETVSPIQEKIKSRSASIDDIDIIEEIENDGDEDNDVGHKYNIPFVRQMFDEESKKMTYCDPNKHKYIEMMLRDLEKSDLNSYRKRTRSIDIENDYLEWKTSCVQKKDGCWYWKKKMRIQIIDGDIYLSTNKYEIAGHIYDKEGYRTGLIFYLSHLKRKYPNILKLINTDFIFYYHDFKRGGGKMEERYNWRFDDRIPYFFTDYNLAHLSTDNLLLLTVPRAYLKYKYFAEKVYENNKYLNQYNYRRIADYFQWMDLLKNLSESSNLDLLTWNGKSINRALFRGANNARWRYKIYDILVNKSSSIYHDYPNFDKYFDIQMTNFYALVGRDGDRKNRNLTLSLREQLKYRYMIVLDGVSVRDSLMYQMKMGMIILKQLTTNVEFWYFDVINGFHWIVFENIPHLISIVTNLVSQVDGFYDEGILKQNEYEYLSNHLMTEFNYNKLKEITENSKTFINEYLNETNIDCFFIHMLQLYNHYLFDVNSINKSSDEYMRELDPNIYV